MHIGDIVKVGEREPTYTPAQAEPERAPQPAAEPLRAIPELFPGIPATNPDHGEPVVSPDREPEREPAFVEPRREPAEPLKEREFEET